MSIPWRSMALANERNRLFPRLFSLCKVPGDQKAGNKEYLKSW